MNEINELIWPNSRDRSHGPGDFANTAQIALDYRIIKAQPPRRVHPEFAKAAVAELKKTAST